MIYAVLKHKVSDEAYKDYVLTNPITTLGRSSSNDVVINDSSISRLHVRIENRNGQFFVVDNNSSNGTFLNRRKITEAPLKDGDALMVGRVYFYFVQRAKEPDEAGRTQPLVVMDPKSPTSIASTLSMNLNAPKEPSPASAATSKMPRSSKAPPPGWSQEFTPTEDILVAQEKVEASRPPSPPNYTESPPPMPPKPIMGKPPAPPSAGFGATPKARAEKVRARPMRRLLAYLIDVAVNIGLFLPGMAISFFASPEIGGLLTLVGMLVAMAHPLYGWFKYGKTLGKHWMGIRIIASDQPNKVGLDVGVLIKRIIGYMVSSIFFLGFLYILLNEQGLGVHDKIAGTEVVED